MANHKQAKASRSRPSPVRATPTLGTVGRPAEARPTSAGKPRPTSSMTPAASGEVPPNGGAAPTMKVPAPRAEPVRTGAPGGGGWRELIQWIAGSKLEFATLVVSLAGLGVATYMTIQHFTTNTYAGCSAHGAINCEAVTSSPEARVFGIPVAVLGLAFFAFMVAINSPWGWRASPPLVHWVRLVSVIVGVVFVLWLVYAELFLINAICLYCTSVHILQFLLFALVITRVAISGLRPRAAIR